MIKPALAQFRRESAGGPAPLRDVVGGHVLPRVPVAQLALAWCLREPWVSSVIVGATKTSHVDDNVAAADLELGDGVLDRVDELLEPVAES